MAMSYFISSPGMACPSGSKSSGGICQCDQGSLWNQGPWNLQCTNGLCKAKSKQAYDKCKSKKNGSNLKDGSYCWDKHRVFNCPMLSGNLLIRLSTNYIVS